MLVCMFVSIACEYACGYCLWVCVCFDLYVCLYVILCMLCCGRGSFAGGRPSLADMMRYQAEQTMLADQTMLRHPICPVSIQTQNMKE